MPAPVAPGSRDRSSIDAPEPADLRERGALDPATDRLQALLRGDEPWRDQIGDRVAAVRLAVRSSGVVVAVVVAIGLGAGAFVLLGGGRAASVDPVQVLPRVDAAGADALPGPGPAPGPAPAAASGPPGTAPDGPSGTIGPPILVHAAGAVAVPGIHRVPAAARVADLIAAAGGLAPDADPDRINLAASLRDGERVYVPRRGELAAPDVVAGRGDPAPGGGPSSGAPTTVAGPATRVDLNTADAAALDALPGIGPATAAAIIGHRTEHGPFTSVDELQEVAGIGPAKLAQLRELVRV